MLDGAKQETAKQAEQPETRKLGQEKEDFVPTTQEEVQTPEAATDLQGPLAQLVQKQAFAPKEAKIFSTPTASETAETQKQQDAEGGSPDIRYCRRDWRKGHALPLPGVRLLHGKLA